MDRRTLLKTGSLAALGLGFGGCAARNGVAVAPSTQFVKLPPVRASWDRVIRTTVGLRPHRPSGFVLKAEKFGAKTVIHNYGHGGSGHSLAWGTGSMAADLAIEHGERRVAVLGCGTVGLTAARQLQRRGFEVTIYTEKTPPYTTSNMAWAGFTPTSSLVTAAGRTPAWEAQFRQAAEISYRQLQLMVGPRYGVSWIDDYGMMDSAVPPQRRSTAQRRSADRPIPEPDGLLPSHLETGRSVLGPGEHPFPSPYASLGLRMRIEPSTYLDALMRDVIIFGGKIVIRKFERPRDLMTLEESLIINCTALGSRELFGDQELTPVKGQLTFLVPQPEVNYLVNGILRSADGSIHRVGTMPRSDGIALGFMALSGVWSLEPNEDAIKRTVEAHIAFYEIMRGRQPGIQMRRVEASRDIPKLESFFGLES